MTSTTPTTPTSPTTSTASIAATITSKRWAWLIVAIGLFASMAIAGMLGQAKHVASPTDSLPVGSDSAQALALREKLPEADGSVALVLFTKNSDKLSPADLKAIGMRMSSIPEASKAPLVPSQDGTAALTFVTVNAPDSSTNADKVKQLRTAVKQDLPLGVSAQVTGPAAIKADLAAVFQGANTRLLIATASIVAFLLVLTYRSPILWIIPLLVVGVADRLAAVVASHALGALGLVFDESTIGILSVLVFGAGTDYALLLISRYRDELRHDTDRRRAMAHALTRTAEAVVSSASTVIVGLLTLALSLFPATRGLGVACAIGVAVAAAYVLLVLPAALVLCDRWIFWPRVPHTGEASLADGESFWRRVGNRVAASPRRVIVGTLVLLGVMAIGLGSIQTGLKQSEQFLQKPEAIAASERLAQSFPAGSSDPAIVVTTANADRVLALVKDTPGVASAATARTGQGVTEINAVLEASPGTPQAQQTVLKLRSAVAIQPGTHIAGSAATALDKIEGSARDRMVIFPLVLLLVMITLGLLLRAVVAPIILVLTVVATYLASLGASWWIFTKVFNFSALDESAPLFAFVFLVALGVDYNIFLVSRAREEARHYGSREGMLRGLAATGGVITSAGVLLAAVFAVLGVLPLVVLAQIGVIICIGVLIDTLVVRTLLVPAIALVLGDAFWWPQRPSVPEASLAAATARPTA